jgi:MFS family permease
VLGPALGGIISQAFGWRSTFALLAALGGAVLVLLIFFLPETHQFLVLERLQKQDPAAAAGITEAAAISAYPPKLKMPWRPLATLFNLTCAVPSLIALMSFACFFVVLGQLSTVLAVAPYNLSQAVIGACMLPMGLAGMIASPLGGWLADRAAAAAANGAKDDESSSSKYLRLKGCTLLTASLAPVGLLAVGWAVDYQLHAIAACAGSVLVAAAAFAYFPAYCSWLANLDQQAAALVTGAAQAMSFLVAGGVFQFASAAVVALGLGKLFSVLAGVQLVLSLLAFMQFANSRHDADGVSQQADAAAAASSREWSAGARAVKADSRVTAWLDSSLITVKNKSGVV